MGVGSWTCQKPAVDQELWARRKGLTTELTYWETTELCACNKSRKDAGHASWAASLADNALDTSHLNASRVAWKLGMSPAPVYALPVGGPGSIPGSMGKV